MSRFELRDFPFLRKGVYLHDGIGDPTWCVDFRLPNGTECVTVRLCSQYEKPAEVARLYREIVAEYLGAFFGSPRSSRRLQRLLRRLQAQLRQSWPRDPRANWVREIYEEVLGRLEREAAAADDNRPEVQP